MTRIIAALAIVLGVVNAVKSAIASRLTGFWHFWVRRGDHHIVVYIGMNLLLMVPVYRSRSHGGSDLNWFPNQTRFFIKFFMPESGVEAGIYSLIEAEAEHSSASSRRPIYMRFVRDDGALSETYICHATEPLGFERLIDGRVEYTLHLEIDKRFFHEPELYVSKFRWKRFIGSMAVLAFLGAPGFVAGLLVNEHIGVSAATATVGIVAMITGFAHRQTTTDEAGVYNGYSLLLATALLGTSTSGGKIRGLLRGDWSFLSSVAWSASVLMMVGLGLYSAATDQVDDMPIVGWFG